MWLHRNKAATKVQARWRTFSTKRRVDAERCGRATICIHSACLVFLARRRLAVDRSQVAAMCILFASRYPTSQETLFPKPLWFWASFSPTPDARGNQYWKMFKTPPPTDDIIIVPPPPKNMKENERK